VILRLLLAREIARFSQGFGQPDGGFARVRVVGVTRAPTWAEPATDVSVTPAFARVHASDVSSRGVFVRLRSTDPASRDAFAAALAGAYAADPYHSPLDGLLRPEPYFPTTSVDPTVRAAQVVLLAGLVVFGVVVGLGGLLIVAQGLLRHHGGRRHVQRIERALGMTLVERAVARVLAGGSERSPRACRRRRGRARVRADRAAGQPGPVRADAGVPGAVGGRAGRRLSVALLFGAMTAVAAAVVARPRRPVPRCRRPATPRSGAGPRCWRASGWPGAVRGPRAGPDRGHRRRARAGRGGDRRDRDVPGEPAAARRHPARYGLTSDLTIVDAASPTWPSSWRTAASPRWTSSPACPATFGDDARPLQLLSVEHRKGRASVETVAWAASRSASARSRWGRAPATGSESGVSMTPGVAPLRPVFGWSAGACCGVSGIVVSRADADDPSARGRRRPLAQLRALSATAGYPAVVSAYPPWPAPEPGRASCSASWSVATGGARTRDPRRDPQPRRPADAPEVLALVLAAVGGAAVVPRAARRPAAGTRATWPC
jgi:hypothetical protein